MLDFKSSLVLSLPTSAGKTRIAELAILTTLAQRRRVVFVTPLRALSAQTEATLQRTFRPLGLTVSSLYGSAGTSMLDVNALAESDIVVATPEKLDFALRNDPNLIDDVGLVVLDEGHMIGLSEREVRYEAQIQRLLRRDDARSRRLLCLSAILPDGDQLSDFAEWLCPEETGGFVKEKWRPTRLRFGEIEWRSDRGKLTLNVGEETPFVPGFVKASAPTSGRRRRLFPADQRELCIAAAWRFADDGHSVLIYCPRRDSVDAFARCIAEAHASGLIPSLLAPESAGSLEDLLAIGAEWFGTGHPINSCLKLGVAIHHGSLPVAYRQELERLLKRKVFPVTVSSPTLAQGLNLSASVLVFHGLHRSDKPIEVSEFRNVVGRAGRAFVDVEGLVVYPMFSKVRQRTETWRALIDEAGGREMESGLLRLTAALASRLARGLGTTSAKVVLDYLAGHTDWSPPRVQGEKSEEAASAEAKWWEHVATLDTAILSLLGEVDESTTDVAELLDSALRNSLFLKRLQRRTEPFRLALLGVVHARASALWKQTTAAQRRGYFLAGVDLQSGQVLDQCRRDTEALLADANVALERGIVEDFASAVCRFAAQAFRVPAFRPPSLPLNWQALLADWLLGRPIVAKDVNDSSDVLKFIEGAVVYRLTWAMEAVRVCTVTVPDEGTDPAAPTTSSNRFASIAVETGVPSIAAALLIRAGFSSRTAALKAAFEGNAAFTTWEQLGAWLHSDGVRQLSRDPKWPTAETHKLWNDFLAAFSEPREEEWVSSSFTVRANWERNASLAPDMPVILRRTAGADMTVLSPQYQMLGSVREADDIPLHGLVTARVSSSLDSVVVDWLGPNTRPPGRIA